ncbi:MAG: UDP-3-O-(3-hydroxymyristoyl)glucosamine N-acyltransferase [Planctomycetota bacterium]
MTLQELADRLGATVVGDGTAAVAGCAPIQVAGPDEITFLANRKYARFLETTRAAAVLVDPGTTCPGHLARLVIDDPYFAFRNAMIELHGFRRHPEPAGEAPDGVSTRASIHPEATVGAGTLVHPGVVVDRGARVGRDGVLYPGVYIGPDARVGDGCLLYPNVVIYDRCVVGDRVILHANTVIGSDGFGYATHGGVHHKIPQAGIVVIEDDVELGVGNAIERAAMGETRIGRGTKFADLNSIGHGTTIGAHCLFVSLIGVAGSVEVGDYVVLGGQVAVAGHLRIGDGVQAMGRTAIARDVPDGQKVGGVPAVPYDQAKRNALAGVDLYGLFQRVRKLERELERRKSEGA